MAINLSDSIRVGQQKPIEDRSFNGLVPYTDVVEANSLIASGVRHRGLLVFIDDENFIYSYRDGIADLDLVPLIKRKYKKLINITETDTPYVVLEDDEVIIVNNEDSSETHTILLPYVTNLPGREITVKVLNPTIPFTLNITVPTIGEEENTVEGVEIYIFTELSNLKAVTLIANEENYNWDIINSY